MKPKPAKRKTEREKLWRKAAAVVRAYYWTPSSPGYSFHNESLDDLVKDMRRVILGARR